MFEQPPKSLCILRLSAIGDVTHMLPVIATLQQQWPETEISWIIGSVEYQLVKSVTGVKFIVFNKKNGLREYKKLRSTLATCHFDVLLMMQVALRASLISLLVKADLKIGYDRQRARDFHSLFCNQTVTGLTRIHVLDTFFQFIEKMGIMERNMNWLLTPDQKSYDFAQNIIKKQNSVIINPCSSMRKNNYRNWSQQNYTAIIDYLMSRDIKVIITGGASAKEIKFTQDIVKQCQKQPINLAGKTTLAELLALLAQSCFLIAPDTGPAHMATVVGIPVIGLYAGSNPLRTGPYHSQQFLINGYPQALKKFKGKTCPEERWGERIRYPDVMQIISVKQVIIKIDSLCAQMKL